jgi:hypothetical protein
LLQANQKRKEEELRNERIQEELTKKRMIKEAQEEELKYK